MQPITWQQTRLPLAQLRRVAALGKLAIRPKGAALLDISAAEKHPGEMGSRRAGASLLLCALFLAATAPPAQGSFFEDFSSGWKSRWTHSTESKYNGKFTVETPEGLETPGLKVVTDQLSGTALLPLSITLDSASLS